MPIQTTHPPRIKWRCREDCYSKLPTLRGEALAGYIGTKVLLLIEFECTNVRRGQAEGRIYAQPPSRPLSTC